MVVVDKAESLSGIHGTDLRIPGLPVGFAIFYCACRDPVRERAFEERRGQGSVYYSAV